MTNFLGEQSGYPGQQFAEIELSNAFFEVPFNGFEYLVKFMVVVPRPL